MPGDYFNLFEKNLFFVDNDFIEFVSIENADDGKTILRVKEKDIFAFDISDRENSLKVSLKNPKDVYDKIIVVDPAHGGMDFGVNNGVVLEKDITLKICEKIEELSLNSNKFKVYLTRSSDDYIKDAESFFC